MKFKAEDIITEIDGSITARVIGVKGIFYTVESFPSPDREHYWPISLTDKKFELGVDENFTVTITYRAEDVKNLAGDMGVGCDVKESVAILKRIKKEQGYDEDIANSLLTAYIDQFYEERDAASEADKLKDAIWTDKYNKKRGKK